MFKSSATTLLAAGLLTVSLAACGDTSTSVGAADSKASFGTACDDSFAGAADKTVSTALAENPNFSIMSQIIKNSNMEGVLNSYSSGGKYGFTVFAVPDSVWKENPDHEAFMADKPRAADVLDSHIIEKRLSPADLPGKHGTVGPYAQNIQGEGENFTIGYGSIGADEKTTFTKIVCGNIQTANATVYVVDEALSSEGAG